MIAKPKSIKSTGGKSGGCAWKAIELTSGDLLREQLLRGTYQPQPVRRVEIPKPDGGVRKLGIPTVLDRLIQQAVMQVLQRRWDPTFSEHSHGELHKRSMRPGLTKIACTLGQLFNLKHILSY
jgi:RNA-directed DNA polymerase